MEKTKLAGELQQKSEDLKSSDQKREELEGTITALQDDLDDRAKGAEILNKELLQKLFSIPFRYNTCHLMGL